MSIVRDYIEAFQVEKEKAFFLESTYHTLKNHIESNDKFIATNDVLRARFKSTSVLLVAIEEGYDILVPYEHMKKFTKENIERIEKTLGITSDVDVHSLGNPQHLYGLGKRLLVDEMPYAKTNDFQKVAIFTKGGYIHQKCYKELVKEGLA